MAQGIHWQAAEEWVLDDTGPHARIVEIVPWERWPVLGTEVLEAGSRLAHGAIHPEQAACPGRSPSAGVEFGNGTRREHAMATAIRERERIQATPSGLVRDRYADPTMTRAAREKRIAWWLDHLDEWQRDLEDLAHYDPRYAYDVAHEYDHDWTTDPDYGPRAIDLLEFDEDGVQYREDTRPQAIELHMRDTLQDRFGHRVVYQNRYGFVEEIAENLGWLTRQGRPSNTIKPDLMVMPSEEELLGDQDPDRRPRPDDPVPELVLEILSESTAARDLGDKRLLYEALGVHEYLVYDLGDKRRPGSPRELLLYRLEGGIYRQMAPEPKRSSSDPDRHWSDVFGTYIRFLPDVRENAEEFRKLPEGNRPPPRFQWWDTAESRWRDHETDAEIERDRVVQERDRIVQENDRIAQERDQAVQERNRLAQERTSMAIDLLRAHLGSELATAHRNRIEAVWHRDGPPTDVVDRILQVRSTPDAWQSLLLPDKPDNDTGSAVTNT
ncbi:MAG: Uma2 family endonuclease [Caldilineaceae bacterium SB0665_bin_21]|nr:Uma2 family endonuclease [Caldilineaceae bacterium SB0665_bin_21]